MLVYAGYKFSANLDGLALFLFDRVRLQMPIYKNVHLCGMEFS